MKQLTKFLWLSSLVALPAYANELNITGEISLSGDSLALTKEDETLEKDETLVKKSARLTLEKEFELAEENIKGVLRLGLSEAEIPGKNETLNVVSDKINKSLYNKSYKISLEDIVSALKVDSQKKTSKKFIAPMLSEVYFDYGMFRLGITDTIFVDGGSLPKILHGKQFFQGLEEYEDADYQLSWRSEPSDEGLSYATSVQVSEEDVCLIGNAKYSIDEKDHLQGGLLLSLPNYDDDDWISIDTNIGGKFEVIPDMLSAMFNATASVSEKKLRFSDQGLSRLSTIKNDILSDFNIVLGAEYKILPELTSTCAYVVVGKDIDKGNSKLATNLSYKVSENLSLGSEYISLKGLSNILNPNKTDHSLAFTAKIKL